MGKSRRPKKQEGADTQRVSTPSGQLFNLPAIAARLAAAVASATAAAAAAATAAPAPTTAAAARLTRTSLVNREGATVELHIVLVGDSRLKLGTLDIDET